eukprot:3836789-Rhodomonas_salina.1
MGWIDEAHTPRNKHIRTVTLKQTGVHTRLGMIGYVQKDREELWFRLFVHELTDNDLRSGREEYALWGALRQKRASITLANFLDKIE